jgi:multidrug efflux pump subunit AcrB
LALPAVLAQEFPEARARVKLLPNGPPVPYPVQFRVVGSDPGVLRQKAEEVKAVMRQNASTRGVNDNWNESVKVVRLEIDQAKARALAEKHGAAVATTDLAALLARPDVHVVCITTPSGAHLEPTLAAARAGGH